MRLLVVEDEKRMAQALCALLRQEGYDVDVFFDGLEGQSALESGAYDLAILDVMLPHRDGFQIAKAARVAGLRTPILMLTAKGELDNKVHGLDCGADDYLTKPFMARELLARLRALGRRQQGSLDGTLRFGDIRLDPGAGLLSCGNNSVRLGEKELHILEYLLANPGQVLSREQLALKVWGYDSDSEYNNVEVYMFFVRRKLNFVGSQVEIKALRGLGYTLRYKDV